MISVYSTILFLRKSLTRKQKHKQYDYYMPHDYLILL